MQDCGRLFVSVHLTLLSVSDQPKAVFMSAFDSAPWLQIMISYLKDKEMICRQA